MSESIAKWFRSGNIVVLEGMVEKREKGIDNFLENGYDYDDILNLTKLFFGKECTETFLEKFVEKFAEADSTFADDQKKEIYVLAGIILSRMCENQDMDDIFSIAIYVKSYAFLRNKPVLERIYLQIVSIYEKAAAEKRESIMFNYEGIKSLPKDVSFTINEGEIFEINDGDAKKLSLMIKKINELCTFINKNYRDLANKNKILYENTEILWWLLAGFSQNVGKTYAELPLQQAALLVGKDLAEIVENKPGLYSADNLLCKVLDKNKDDKALFASYIDSCSDDIIEKMFMESDSSINTPILFALNKKIEVGEGSWYKVFEKNFGKTDIEYSGIEFAYQMYLECLMRKWLS